MSNNPHENQDDQFVVLEISDNGTGIPLSIQERIFDPFFTTKFQGRGLGLAIVVGNVKSHHGIIQIQSQIGKGTTFQIFFPISKQIIPELSTNLVSLRYKELIANLRNLNVLVIDDEEIVRKTLKNLLTRHSITVITEENGLEAIRLIQNQPFYFDAIFLDLTMPVIDGLKVLQLIREVNPTVPGILISGYSAKNVQQVKAKDINVHFIQKPFKMDEILIVFQDIIK